MDISRLEEFVALSRTLNYSETAARLHMSQSTLSKHVIALEKELGIGLVNHGDRPTLTKAGVAFAGKMSDVLELYRASISELEAMKSRERIVVGVPHVSKARALGALSAFEKKHPGVSIDYRRYAETPDIIADVKSGKIDCGIYGHSFTHPELDDGLSAVSCGKDEFVLWVDRASDLASKEQVAPRDLEGLRMPTPTGPTAEAVTLLHEGFAKVFGVDIVLKYRHLDSVDNFFFSEVGAGDVLIFHKDFESNDAITLRDDRAVRRFEPAVLANSYIVYSENSSNEALRRLVGHLSHDVSE